ncbi:hypothetical protein SDC9_203629 [bioreactor metagenome]|uniref:Uncharacterized protein n=1 Tax=bioreactor metagenome TaxID=1076179 RepID=A0A645IX00_9ZZZZ
MGTKKNLPQVLLQILQGFPRFKLSIDTVNKSMTPEFFHIENLGEFHKSQFVAEVYRNDGFLRITCWITFLRHFQYLLNAAEGGFYPLLVNRL